MTGQGGLQLRTREEGVVSPDHYRHGEREKKGSVYVCVCACVCVCVCVYEDLCEGVQCE